MSELRDRAAGKEVQQHNGAGTLQNQIRQMESQFQMAMPKGMEAARLVRDALTALRQNPKLAECSPQSVLGGLMTCSQLGLRPGVLGHAWLLPFWDSRSKRHHAQLVIGYQGIVDLAHRSGRIASLIARTVYERDTFDVDYGLSDNLIHKPLMAGDRGEPVAYYAIAKFNGGGHAFHVMSQADMERHRDRFAMARDKSGRVLGPWKDHFEAMAHKTVMLQLAKWFPKSTELSVGIEADQGVRVDLSPDADAAEVTHHYDDGEVVDGEVVDEPPAEGEPWPDAAQPGSGGKGGS